jgi:PhnB protein
MTVGGITLMASDAPAGRYAKPQGFSLSIGVESPAEAERIFQALAEKGNIVMPMGESFFALRFGMLTDQFDVPWMVICQKTA